jgi:hypothetical protein
MPGILWGEAGATDGLLVIQPAVGLRDFTDHTKPELIRCSIFRSEYEGGTLRKDSRLQRPKKYYIALRKQASKPKRRSAKENSLSKRSLGLELFR